MIKKGSPRHIIKQEKSTKALYLAFLGGRTVSAARPHLLFSYGQVSAVDNVVPAAHMLSPDPTTVHSVPMAVLQALGLPADGDGSKSSPGPPSRGSSSQPNA